MEQERNKKGIITFLVIVIILLIVLCFLFATKTINSKESEVNDNSSNMLDSNIIVTKNGKAISNEIPSDLVGKYVNKNSNESYIKLTNDSVEVSEPTGGNATIVFKDEQVKLFINYLNTDKNSNQYVTIEFYIENSESNQKATYTYIGSKSSQDNEYHFKTIDPTPVGGEGNNDYPYGK